MKPIKKIILAVLCVVGVVFLVGVLISKPLISFLLKQQMVATFPYAKVEIERCAVKPFFIFSVQGIKVIREGMYSFRIQEASVEVSLNALFRKSVPKVFIQGVSVEVKTKRNLAESFADIRIPEGGKSFFIIQELQLSEAQAHIVSKDVQLDAFLSTTIHLPSQRITALSLDIPSLEVSGCTFKEMHADLRSLDTRGDLQIAQIGYNKVSIKALKAKFGFFNNEVILDPWSARFLNGEIQGDLKVFLRAPITYLVTVNTINLDIETFVKEFGLTEKFQMDGKIAGAMALGGEGLSFISIKGDLLTAKPGGTLTIKDTRFLESIAGNSEQSLDMLVDGFKDYPYTDGAVGLSLDKGNVLVDVALAGERGKRNFQIVLHDFDLEQLLEYLRYQ